jgi:hypothetical protein
MCGGSLQVNTGGPETAPWRCGECLWSWWTAEVSQDALRHFRRERIDYGDGGTPGLKSVRRAVEVEAELAQIRGVSLRQDQLDLVSTEALSSLLARWKIHESLAEQMRERVMPDSVPSEWSEV